MAEWEILYQKYGAHTKMKIYTKTGDKGTTFNGKERVPKYDCSIDGQGELDELNAWIGMVRKSLPSRIYQDFDIQNILQSVQENLFNIGGQLATQKQMLKDEDIATLEGWIDTLNEKLPELKNFIYPLETPNVHVARAVCRRAERVVSRWEAEWDCMHSVDDSPQKFELVVPYLNRLIDFLFVLARYYSESSEQIWQTDRNDH